jgi:hypothetical protein
VNEPVSIEAGSDKFQMERFGPNPVENPLKLSYHGLSDALCKTAKLRAKNLRLRSHFPMREEDLLGEPAEN